MDVHLSPDLESKLSHMAAQQGRAAETLVLEAMERLVAYEGWFLQEVGEGLSADDRGEFIEHSEVRQTIDSRYPG